MAEKPGPSISELLGDENFKDELVSVLGDKVSEKQVEVIDNLPDDLLVHLRGHLAERYRRQRDLNKGGEYIDEVKVIAGELFEELIRADDNFPETTELSEELLGLLGNPERFRLEKKLNLGRNPDLAFIEIDESTNTLIVKGIGEAKLGGLGSRALEQLAESGSTKSVKTMVREVNKLSKGKLESHGLKEVRERKTKNSDNKQHNVLEIDADFNQVLVLASHQKRLDLETEEKAKLLKFGLRKNDYWVRKLDRVLENVEIRYAAFEGGTVVKMADLLHKKIYEN